MILRPKIGVTQEANPDKLRAYVEAVEAAGGDAVILRPGSPASPEETLDGLDGIVLTGGRDIDPREYGQAPIDGVGVDVDPVRDALELPLARTVVARNLPVLGICRGIQVLNVALGGTLLQDIGLIGLPRDSHDQKKSRPELSLDAAVHVVALTPGSRLGEIVGADRLGVNSSHHQAIDRVAPGLVVTARSIEPETPGLVEAVEAPTARFVVGVQWHPERMWKREPACARLFQALIRAARRTRVQTAFPGGNR